MLLVRWLLHAGLALSIIGLASPALAQGGGSSLRFYGAGRDQVDRVKIPIDPARPVDVGGDFTIEFWMKANRGDNGSGACSMGGDNWINGNSMFDRDVFNQGDHGDYGISLAGGKLAFGVNNGSDGNTICGTTDLADGVWHHVALTRNSQSGALRIFVDGQPDAEGSGPAGDISYRDGRATDYPTDPFLVLGAEKHDYDRAKFPSYSGWLDEIRISTALRYSDAFAPPTGPFAADGDTAALYHLDEGDGETLGDSSGATGGPSNGQINFGGDPVGPAWSSDTPFGAAQTEPTAAPRTEIPTAAPAQPTPSPTSSEPTAIPTATSDAPTAVPTATSDAPSAEPTAVSNEPSAIPTTAMAEPAATAAAPAATAPASADQAALEAERAQSSSGANWLLIPVVVLLIGLGAVIWSRRVKG